MTLIQYDEVKNRINLRKHNISIPELATIFSNKHSEVVMDIPDEKHSVYEDCYYAYGWTSTGFYVLAWYTYRGDNVIRIIGGRKLK